MAKDYVNPKADTAWNEDSSDDDAGSPTRGTKRVRWNIVYGYRLRARYDSAQYSEDEATILLECRG